MDAYKKYLTISDQKQIVLSNLPFSPGQQVEIIIIAENPPTENLTSRFKKLLKETQALHEESPLSEEDIQTEIDAYRRGE